MSLSCRAVIAALMMMIVCGCGASAASAPSVEPAGAGAQLAWDQLAPQRSDVLKRLAEPILACIQRTDSGHPAFHGCVDWHSAVHATYALLAVARITGQPEYRDAALRASGQPIALAAEVAQIRDGSLGDERPYGFAWALILDVEADRSSVTSFHELGVAARDQLAGLLSGVPARRGMDEGAQDSYGSLSWATYALHAWAVHFGDRPGQEIAEAAAGALLLDETVARHCRPEVTTAEREFFSPCYLDFLLAAELGRTGEALSQAREVVLATRPLPGSAMRNPHTAGLNFSRAWGVYGAWRLLRDPRLLDVWAELVSAHLAMPGYWRSDYWHHAHWVAQFGVFAIAATFDP